MRRSVLIGSWAGAVVLGSCLALGCATIMKGSKQEVKLTSSPTPARVVVQTAIGEVSVFEGTTPTSVKLNKDKEYVVTFSLDGYTDATMYVSKEGIEGWFFGNLLCGGIIGIIVDASNGAMNKIGPDELHAELRTAQIPGEGETLYAVLRALDSDGQLRSIAVPLVRER